MNRKISWYAAGLLVLAMTVRAAVIVYNATLVNETALAYSNTYSVDLQANGINSLSAQAVYSSATVSNDTFKDGAQSTGSFTVVTYTALSSASATDNLTVVNNSLPANALIGVPGYVFYNNQDWAVGNTSSNTALSIKNALATVPWLSVSVSGNVIYATATYGSRYNSMYLTSNTSSITSNTTNFTGGQDNAYVRINGVTLVQGQNWNAVTSNAQTATNLAAAINAAGTLNTKLSAGAASAKVTSTSTFAGSLYNYSQVSSTPTALSVNNANMTGGVTPAFTLASSLFSVPSHGLTLALPVLYSGTPAIGGLATGTTYYAVPVDANSFKLAKFSTSAVAGIDLVVITSTNTQLTQDTYTLAPLGISGIPSFKWQVSNDNSNWNDLAVSSVTMGSTGTAYATPPTSTFWSFGYIGARYLRLNAVAPTTGGIKLTVTVIGTN